MKVRFLADADLNRAIVSGVLRREPSLDFLTAQAAGLRRMNDPEVLALAAELRRVLVSHRRRHDTGSLPHIQAHWKAELGCISHPSEPRYWNGNRRTADHLARIGRIGVGKPIGVVALVSPFWLPSLDTVSNFRSPNRTVIEPHGRALFSE